MKITFVTFHNWKTKRQGGFHKFAERCSLEGHEVVFLVSLVPIILFSKR